MSLKLVFSVVAVFLTITACGEEGGSSLSEPSPNDDWVPLELGNTWNYIYTDTASSSPDTLVSYRTVEQTGLTMPFADNVAMLTNYAGIVADTLYYESDDDYLRIWHSAGDSLWISVTLLDLPLEVGKTWTYSGQGSVTVTAECVSLSDTVVVPAGTFTNCAKIKYSGGEVTKYTYFAPGVGEVLDQLAGYTDVMKLESYTVNWD